MSLLVTGSIGIDTVETPSARADEVLGGSAVYFAFAARLFTPVRLVGVVGDDFPPAFRDLLSADGIDIAGLEERKGSKTFRWTGRYLDDINERETLDVALNVLAEDAPDVPSSFADSTSVFLANTHPGLQRQLAAQVPGADLVVCDTMNLWIENERDALIETLRGVQGVIINDGEAKQLTGKNHLIDAGEEIQSLGPEFVIIKKGEHGAMLLSSAGPVVLPAYPSRNVVDPTGAGDSFAGGVLGYLQERGSRDPSALRDALVRGTVTASFTIEDFSLNRLRTLTRDALDQRVDEFVTMLRF